MTSHSSKQLQLLLQISKSLLLGSLSALSRPRGCCCAYGGVYSPIFPWEDKRLPKQHDPADPAVTCPVLVYGPRLWLLPSFPVSLWVVCLASRELARPCRPLDIFTSRHRQRGLSVEKFLPTSGLLSPQTPTLAPSRQLGFQSVGSNASNKRACMLRLDWVSMWLTIYYRHFNSLPAAVNLTASATVDLEQPQHPQQHLAGSDR